VDCQLNGLFIDESSILSPKIARDAKKLESGYKTISKAKKSEPEQWIRLAFNDSSGVVK